MWSATAAYAQAAQLEVSASKSGVFADTLAGRVALEALDPAAPVLLTFKDLGVQQHAGARGATAMAARVQAARARFERLEGLPLPHAKRALVVAAAGVSAARYGAIAGAPSNRVLAQLRTWAGRAIWRGGRFGAVDDCCWGQSTAGPTRRRS